MKIPFVLEDRRVPKTAIIVEGEKAVTAKNLGREHGNRGKTALSTKLTAKSEKFRKTSASINYSTAQPDRHSIPRTHYLLKDPLFQC